MYRSRNDLQANRSKKRKIDAPATVHGEYMGLDCIDIVLFSKKGVQISQFQYGQHIIFAAMSDLERIYKFFQTCNFDNGIITADKFSNEVSRLISAELSDIIIWTPNRGTIRRVVSKIDYIREDQFNMPLLKFIRKEVDALRIFANGNEHHDVWTWTYNTQDNYLCKM